MRLVSFVMLLAAAAMGIGAAWLMLGWLDQQRRTAAPALKQEILTAKVVVAAKPLRFGNPVTPDAIREVDWPAGAIPAGIFSSQTDLLKAGGRRLALAAIEPNEPIFNWKITGPGQRATLSALIGSGMKAVTIRVNDVLGVAGFVLPGERVDVLMTRTENRGEDGGGKGAFTDVLLQNVRVLAIDQLADERAEKPSLVKAVTLEVKIEDGQKLVLASTVGNLALALRPAGAAGERIAKRITPGDLGSEAEPVKVAQAGGAEEAAPAPKAKNPATKKARRGGRVTIGVTRALKRQEYRVKPESLWLGSHSDRGESAISD